MAVQRISEKEFRTRRRDRRMVWVDALAFLVGLLVVTASVGGVIFYEREVEPIEWTPVFLEQPVMDDRTCYGYVGGDQKGEACVVPISPDLHQEGEDVERMWPAVTQANVTQVSFRLSWTDELPDPNEPCEENKYCNRNFEYDENSTAIMRLQVHTPWGEVIEDADHNAWEGVMDGDTIPSGSIRITVPVLALPEDVPTYETFTQGEAEAHFNDTYRQDEHEGLGEWKTVVTLVRDSRMNGTFPKDPCTEAGLAHEDVPDGEENCDMYDEYELIMGPGQGGSNDGLPTAYPGFYGAYGQATFDPVRPTLNEHYKSSYRGEGQKWLLTMSVKGYEVMAGV